MYGIMQLKHKTYWIGSLEKLSIANHLSSDFQPHFVGWKTVPIYYTYPHTTQSFDVNQLVSHYMANYALWGYYTILKQAAAVVRMNWLLIAHSHQLGKAD